MYKSLRILYAVGPEDVIEAYNYWVKGQDAPLQVSVPFSSQLYELCKNLDAKALVIAQSKEKKFVQDERFIIKRRPAPSMKASGIFFHIYHIRTGFELLAAAIRFRANVAVVDTGATHWFVLSVFCWMGIKVIPSLHCLLWCKYTNQRLGEKVSLILSRHLFSSQSKAIVVASQDIAEQISQLTEGRHRPIIEFFPTYRQADFANIAEPDRNNSDIFRVLFAGRIEENKGVFDLLEIAKRFAREGQKNIIFDICGEGSALESLRQAALTEGVDAALLCHGYCLKPQMQEMYSRAHVVIVPTRTDFQEGFNRVVCESILSGRPVVTSSVCPALSYVREAVIEVPPNDVKAYGDALLELYKNPELYEQKRQGCLRAQKQFYDDTKSWGFALKSIILEIQNEL